jgi:hypothetical protein
MSEKRRITLEGQEYEVFFNIPRLCKLEKLSGKRIDDLFATEPTLTEVMLILSIGVGKEDVLELDRVPSNFNEVLAEVMEALSYAMGADLKPKKGKKSKKSK